jgi:hypothetical protein
VTLIQKSVNNLIGPKIDLFDWIRGETLNEIAIYLKNRNIPFDNLLDFLENPAIYPGKIIGLKQIIERFLNKTISKHFKTIQAEGLSIKFVLNMVRKNLFQGGWSVKKYQNIAMANRGGDDARKALSPSRIDEPPRLLHIKNKAPKAKLKPKPKKRGSKAKSIKKAKISAKLNQCDYCGSNARLIKIHINICQNPARHRFCSDDCKRSWIFGLIEINEKISQED